MQPDIPRTLIFLHLPKTGGTTIRSILRRNYPPADRLCLKASLAPLAIAFLSLRSRHHAFRCVFGHVSFGLHERIHGPCDYFTMLRDPVDRVVSAYQHLLRPGLHGVRGRRLHRYMTRRGMSLLDYVESDLDPTVSDLQTRMLAGYPPATRAAAPLAEGDFTRAADVLARHVAAVGLMERFEESILLFGQRFGWQDASYVPRNASPQRLPIAPETRAAIAARNPFDTRLYALARDRFDTDIAAYAGDFAADLTRLRERNAARELMARAVNGSFRSCRGPLGRLLCARRG